MVFGFDNYLSLSGSLIGTFEMVLYKNGYIGFNFQSMSTLSGFTSGINFGWNDRAIQYNDGISGASVYGLLFTRPSQSDDLGAQVEIDNTIFPVNNTRNITVSIQNLALSQKSGIEYEFYINNTITNDLTGTVSLDSNEIHDAFFSWTPSKLGLYNLTVQVKNQTNADFELNNRETIWITIRLDIGPIRTY